MKTPSRWLMKDHSPGAFPVSVPLDPIERTGSGSSAEQTAGIAVVLGCRPQHAVVLGAVKPRPGSVGVCGKMKSDGRT
jgi:hypothetical protein